MEKIEKKLQQIIEQLEKAIAAAAIMPPSSGDDGRSKTKKVSKDKIKDNFHQPMPPRVRMPPRSEGQPSPKDNINTKYDNLLLRYKSNPLVKDEQDDSFIPPNKPKAKTFYVGANKKKIKASRIKTSQPKSEQEIRGKTEVDYELHRPEYTKKSELIKALPNGQWVLEKSTTEIESFEKAARNIEPGTFNMDHVNEVVKMKSHGDAKAYANKILADSKANPKNRAKIAAMIGQSKSIVDLARGMTNHLLAHPAEGLKVIKD